MEPILSAAEMRAADAAVIDSGIPSQQLMERAAKAALLTLTADFDTASVLFCCGGGNNGGDGLAMARFFAAKGGKATVCYLGALQEDGTPDQSKMSTECARQLSLLPASVAFTTEIVLDGVTAVVDAIFGIGLTRPTEGRCQAAIEKLNAANLPVLALDIPSGVDADTGAVRGVAVRATKTVAIAAKKYGHLLFPGATLCGEVCVADIGIPPLTYSATLLDKNVLSQLPPRPRRAHKGSFGRVLVVGGSPEMSGAAFLAAKAAYRAGAGIVEILTPAENRTVLATLLPEAIVTCYETDNAEEKINAALGRATAVALGMGLSQSDTAGLLVAAVLRAALPVVIDADALNLIAASKQLMAYLQCRENAILTPHLGECARLTGRSVGAISADLPRAAAALAKASGVVTVLKDAHTVIATERALYLNTYGNSGMATAGSGDVLAGITAAFLAAGADCRVAATCGVVAHALAGDAALKLRGSHGLMASDIIDGLCSVLS